MKTTRITVLVLLLVFALASIGLGYALWSATLHIDGTVNTGNVDMQFTSADSTDGLGALDPPDHVKDVGQTICEIDPLNDQLVLVTVTNAYPSYEAKCLLKWHNNGSIPVKLQSMSCPTAPDWLTVSVQDQLGQVVDPSQSIAGEVKLHVEQDAPQSESEPAPATAFQCELLFSNWNAP